MNHHMYRIGDHGITSEKPVVAAKMKTFAFRNTGKTQSTYRPPSTPPSSHRFYQSRSSTGPVRPYPRSAGCYRPFA